MADWVYLKCEEWNRYNSNCVLCQHCWLLCTACGDLQKGKSMWIAKGGAEPAIVKFNSGSRYVTKEINFTAYNIKQDAETYNFQ